MRAPQGFGWVARPCRLSTLGTIKKAEGTLCEGKAP